MDANTLLTTGGAAVPAVEEPRAIEPTRRTIGRYNLVRQLGAGGMGVVWEAIDPALGRRVAIKLLHGERTAAHADRLRREAQALGQLHHPNVVSVFDVGVDDGEMYLVMQLIAGTTLDRLLARTRLTRGEIVALLVQAGRGLAAAHSADIVHRDFKPSNILVDNDGKVHVSDFGLARLSEAAGDHATCELGAALDVTITRDGLAGTPAYMAPEQLRNGPITPSTDQFSFCVTLWEALAGERPYAGADFAALRDAVLAGRRRELTASVPRRVRAVLMRGLASDPADRFGSMDELLDELEPRRRGVWIAGGVGAIAVAAGVIVLSGTPPAPPEPCSGIDGSLLAGKWDAAASAKVRDAFARTGHRGHGDASARVIANLDGYARDWATQRLEACAATHVRRDQSPALLDLRVTCLDHRAAELAAFARTLGELTQPSAVDKAVAASHDLTPLGTCADQDALLAVMPPPADAVGRERTARATEELYRAQSMGNTGSIEPALALARMVADEIRRIGYAPLVSHALRVLAALEVTSGDMTGAVTHLHEAANAAARGRDDRGVAETWLQLAGVYRRTRKLEVAVALEPVMRSAISRAGDDPDLIASMEVMVGSIERELGQLPEAERRLRGALDLVPTSDVGRRSAITQSYALVLKYAGKFTEARAALAEATTLTERAFGANSMRHVTALYNLARADLALGNCGDALASSERQIEISDRLLGHDQPDQILDYVTLGDIHATCLHREREARTAYERAIRIAEAHPANGMIPTAVGSYGLGLVKLGRAADAVPHLERTIALVEGTSDVPQWAMYSVALGDALLALGRAADALERFRRATTAYEKLGVKLELAWALHGTGGALLALRRPAEAIAPLERATQVVDDSLGEADHRFPQRMLLARALWDANRDRTRAIALAREVVAGYAKAGKRHDKQRAEAEAWLAGHAKQAAR